MSVWETSVHVPDMSWGGESYTHVLEHTCPSEWQSHVLQHGSLRGPWKSAPTFQGENKNKKAAWILGLVHVETGSTLGL